MGRLRVGLLAFAAGPAEVRLVETASAEFVILSDLHLSGEGSPAPDGARAGAVAAAIAGFASSVLSAPANLSRPRLVLLGDTLDLPTHHAGSHPDAARRWATAAADAVARGADAHRAAFDALSALTGSGGHIDLLAGNHDVALQLPAVRAVLLERLGGATGRVAWHPWMLHEPGVLWAEHGNQHHDLHAIPDWLAPPPSRSTWGLPPGRAIEALTAELHHRRPSRRLLMAGAVLAVDMVTAIAARPGLVRRRSAYRTSMLPDVAAAVGVPARVLERIDRLTEADAWSIAARLVRRRIGRGDQGPASFLGPAARRLDAILASEGLAVPVYAFGHTHAPTVLPLGGAGAGPWYANAGSWAGLRPDAIRRRVGPGRLPFLRVRTPGAGQPPVTLVYWNADREQVEDPPG
jgi:hypothetical protein